MDWDELPQSEWENIVLRVDDEGTWHVRYDYQDEYGNDRTLDEQQITWDDFLAIYDEAAFLDQELEIEY